MLVFGAEGGGERLGTRMHGLCSKPVRVAGATRHFVRTVGSAVLSLVFAC